MKFKVICFFSFSSLSISSVPPWLNPLPGAEGPADSPARRIFLELQAAIGENALRPEAGPPAAPGEKKATRLSGDALADSLFRTGFRAARREIDSGIPPREGARALLAALGISMDPSGLLSKNRAAQLLLGRIETPEEGKARARAPGAPTLRGRVDSLQHFAVSAAICAVLGSEAAWAAGLEKETADALEKDRGRGSGFSFADLAADQSGLAFASLILGESASKESLIALLDRLAAEFRGADFVPELERLAGDAGESLGFKDFSARFGSIADPRFVERIAGIGQEVRHCPGYGAKSPPARPGDASGAGGAGNARP